MRYLRGLELSNVVYFKSAKVDLGKNPVTFVRGLNLDSDKKTPTSNYAGKSLLLGSPSTVLFSAPPLSIKKKAKKELLGKKSSIKLTIKTPAHRYRIVQTASSYKIFEDGIDLKVRTVPLAETFIRENIFPLSQLDYYTYCYVSSEKPFRMQCDSDADRLTHLTSLFRLEDYDRLKRFFLDKLGELKAEEIKLQVYEKEALDAKTRLKGIRSKTTVKPSKKKKILAKLSSERKALEREIDRLSKKQYKLSTLRKTLEGLLKIEQKLDDLRTVYQPKLHPQKRKVVLQDLIEKAREYREYKIALDVYLTNVSDIKSKLSKIELPPTKEKVLRARKETLEADSEVLAEKVEKLEAKQESYEAKEAKVVQLQECYTKLSADEQKVSLKKDYHSIIAGLKTTLRLQTLFEDCQDHSSKKSTCPTCLSAVDLEGIKQAVKRAQQELPKVIRLQKAQALVKELQTARAELDAETPIKTKLQRLKKEESVLEEEMVLLDVDLSLYKKHKHLVTLMDGIQKPSKVVAPAEENQNVEALKKELALCQEVLVQLAAREAFVHKLDEDSSSLRTVQKVKARLKEVSYDLSSTEDRLRANRKSLTKILRIYDDITTSSNELEIYTKQFESIQQKINALKPLLKDKNLFESLVRAYSSKGLKTSVASDICSLLEQNLNAYASLIFCEPYTFTVTVSSTGVSIIVDRQNGKQSDVRNMSGAESNCFRLLFAFSILPLIPDDRRINTLTLDEPCSHQDEVSRKKFLTTFLPALSELVPNIFVITPNPDDYCEGSSEWLVRKENGVSSVSEKSASVSDKSSILRIVEAAKRRSKNVKKSTNKESLT